MICVSIVFLVFGVIRVSTVFFVFGEIRVSTVFFAFVKIQHGCEVSHDPYVHCSYSLYICMQCMRSMCSL